MILRAEQEVTAANKKLQDSMAARATAKHEYETSVRIRQDKRCYKIKYAMLLDVYNNVFI